MDFARLVGVGPRTCVDRCELQSPRGISGAIGRAIRFGNGTAQAAVASNILSNGGLPETDSAVAIEVRDGGCVMAFDKRP